MYNTFSLHERRLNGLVVIVRAVGNEGMCKVVRMVVLMRIVMMVVAVVVRVMVLLLMLSLLLLRLLLHGLEWCSLLMSS